jgi:pimeloyl-ACP methyl ester carboxylesterase
LWTGGLGEIAQHRPVLAIDLPGHGWSRETNWPSRSDDGVEIVAAALRPTIRDLGLETAAVAGLHVGGQIALALQTATSTAGGAAIIGAPHYTPAERRRFARHYPPRVGVSPDGGHVLRAWRCVRLQALAFPWFDPSPQAALCPASDALDLQVLHRRAVDLLKAGVNADRAYLSQFAYPTKPAVHRTRAPILRWLQDPLCQPDRIAALAPDAIVDLPARPRDWAAVLAQWRR